VTETDARSILHVTRDASPAEIRRAYLDMVKVWHPDRFQSDARLRDKAQRTLQQINAAYTLLEHGAPASGTKPGGNSSPAPAPTADTLAGDERHAWLQLHPHTVAAVCAGLTLGVALALALIFFRSTPAPAPAADLASASSEPIARPTEAPSQPASPAASPRPRPTTEPPRPDSGTDIGRLGRHGPIGRGALSLRSGLALDAVVELTHDAGHTRRLYLRRGEKMTLLDLVPGSYHVRVALGTDWNGRWFARTSATLELAQQVTVAQTGSGASFEALALLPGDGGLRPAAAFGPD
jgi:hypothetical protein